MIEHMFRGDSISFRREKSVLSLDHEMIEHMFRDNRNHYAADDQGQVSITK